MTSVEEQVKETLTRASDVRDAVHRITLKALSEGKLDSAAIKQVVEAVVSGVRQGAAGLGSGAAKPITDALKGLDDALAAAAKATQLAVQEAAGKASEFSRSELQRSVDDMKDLEATLLSTLNRTASGTTQLAADTLRQFAEHAKTQGTAVGKQVAETLPKLSEVLTSVTKAQVKAGVNTLRSSSALLASMAAGMLSGLAERLQPAAKQQPENQPPAAEPPSDSAK